jgi:REP element-mobilizing transposase RayT
MSGGYKIRDQYALHYLTFQVVYWIDIFSRQSYRDIILESLRFCRKEKELKVHGYVIMSNHVHCILSSEKTDLSTLVKEFKVYTSKQIIKTIKEEPESRREWLLFMFERAAKKHKRNEKYQFWTHENQPKELITNEFMQQKLNYIHENPVRAGIVENAEDYLYSSARNYAGMLSLIQIDLL